MKIMVTSFHRSHACTATVSAPNPAAGHRQHLPLPETPGHSLASLLQTPVGSLLLSPGSWCTVLCLCPPRVISLSCVSSGCFMVWLVATFSKRAYTIPKAAAPRAPAPAAVHCWPVPPQETLRFLSQSLWGPWVLVCTGFVWALSRSLAGLVFDSRRELAPPTVLLGLLLCPWTRGISSAYPLSGVPLTLDMGYLLTASPAKCSPCSWLWTWGVSSQLLFYGACSSLVFAD